MIFETAGYFLLFVPAVLGWVLPDGTAFVLLAIPLVILLIAWHHRSWLFQQALFWIMFQAAMMALPWPFSWIAALVGWAGLSLFFPSLRTAHAWLSRGKSDRLTWLLAGATVFISSTALLTWYLLFRPDLADLLRMLPEDSVLLLVLGGLAFAVGNAIQEELVFRGMLLDGMDRVLHSPRAANLAQAAFFGLAHYQGFPRGWVGVVMAGSYGWMLGLVRQRSRGMTAPVVTHFFADLTIYAILVSIAHGIFS